MHNQWDNATSQKANLRQAVSLRNIIVSSLIAASSLMALSISPNAQALSDCNCEVHGNAKLVAAAQAIGKYVKGKYVQPDVGEYQVDINHPDKHWKRPAYIEAVRKWFHQHRRDIGFVVSFERKHPGGKLVPLAAGTGYLINRCYVVTAKHVMVKHPIDRNGHFVKIDDFPHWHEGAVGRPALVQFGRDGNHAFGTESGVVIASGKPSKNYHSKYDWAIIRVAPLPKKYFTPIPVKAVSFNEYRRHPLASVGYAGGYEDQEGHGPRLLGDMACAAKDRNNKKDGGPTTTCVGYAGDSGGLVVQVKKLHNGNYDINAIGSAVGGPRYVGGEMTLSSFNDYASKVTAAIQADMASLPPNVRSQCGSFQGFKIHPRQNHSAFSVRR